jgi:endoglucanase
MKNVSLIVLAGFAALLGNSCGGGHTHSSSCGHAGTGSKELYYVPNPSNFVIDKGVNVSHWLSQVFGWSPRADFITESDIRLIDSLGFDHIRLPVDEENLWTVDGEIIYEALADLTKCIDWCIKYNIRVVVDLHILRTHHFNSRNGEGEMLLWSDPAAQDNFIKLWEDLSDRLKHYPDSMVAYEPMNEPVAPEHDMWNKLVNRAVKAIRAREPGRVIVFGSNMWQKPHTYPYLDAPRDDKNIILSVHTYHPYFLTHHKAYWSAAKNYTGPVTYPGQTISGSDFDKLVDKSDSSLMARIEEEKALEHHDKAKLMEIMQPAIAKAHELGLQLYCNEFGCLPSVPREMRLRYYSDIIDNFALQGIAYAVWDYKGDFGIVGWDREAYTTGKPDEEIVRILTRRR